MNTRLLKHLLGFVLLSSSSLLVTSTSAASQPQLNIVNLMPDFWRFWQSAEGKPRLEQVALFRSVVIAGHPEAFSALVLQMQGGAGFEEALDARISDLFADLPRRVPDMKKIETQLEENLPGYLAAFYKRFPDLSGPVVVYLMPSLDSFTGEQRPVNGRFVLLLGVDNIAGYSPSANLAPLVEHEMFHLYHFQKVNPFRSVATASGMPIYWWIWDEGFATYAVHLLNPEFADQEVFVSKTDLKKDVAPHVPHLARLLLHNMDSTSPELYGELVSGGQSAARKLHADLPPRSGYVVGYLLVQRLAATHSLDNLTSLTGSDLRSALEQELTAMALDH